MYKFTVCLKFTSYPYTVKNNNNNITTYVVNSFHDYQWLIQALLSNLSYINMSIVYVEFISGFCTGHKKSQGQYLCKWLNHGTESVVIKSFSCRCSSGSLGESRVDLQQQSCTIRMDVVTESFFTGRCEVQCTIVPTLICLSVTVSLYKTSFLMFDQYISIFL